MGSFPLRARSADAATDRMPIDHRGVHHSATASNRCIAELNNQSIAEHRFPIVEARQKNDCFKKFEDSRDLGGDAQVPITPLTPHRFTAL
jgi:hypothetical protein